MGILAYLFLGHFLTLPEVPALFGSRCWIYPFGLVTGHDFPVERVKGRAHSLRSQLEEERRQVGRL